MPEINSDYCSECICHEDGIRHPDASGGGWTWNTGSTGFSWGKTTTDGSTLQGTTVFCKDEWIGDSGCDDVNNIPRCEHDGGINA